MFYHNNQDHDNNHELHHGQSPHEHGEHCDHKHDTMAGGIKFSDLLPIFIAFDVVMILTAIAQYYRGYTWTTLEWNSLLSDFMGFFFLIFGFFKVINLNGFVEAYQVYDIVAQKSKAYAFAYPFIELGLGIGFLMRWNLQALNWVTLVIMLVSSVGVARELMAGRKITCACLGAVFKVPMTYVTLFEDLLMAAMAAFMLM